MSQTADTVFLKEAQFCYWNAKVWLFLAKQVAFNNSVYLQNNFKIFEALNVYSLDGVSMLLPYLITLNTILKICAQIICEIFILQN